MEKKYLYIGGIVLFVLFLFTFLVFFPNLQTKKTEESPNNPTTDDQSSDTDEAEDSSPAVEEPNNLTQQMLYNEVTAIPEVSIEPVKFTNGEAAWDNGPAERGNATFGEKYQQVITDEGYNLINDLYVNTGGSGVFAYIALYRYFADATVLSDYEFLDDRVQVDSITTSTNESPNGEYTIEVNYLARGDEAAMSDEPNVPVKVTYRVSNHQMTIVEN